MPRTGNASITIREDVKKTAQDMAALLDFSEKEFVEKAVLAIRDLIEAEPAQRMMPLIENSGNQMAQQMEHQ